MHSLPLIYADIVRAAPVDPGRPFQPWENSADSSFLNTVLEVVAVANASVDRAGAAADVRIPVRKDDALRAHRDAQAHANLEGRSPRLGTVYRARVGGVRQEAHIACPRRSPMSWETFARTSPSASRPKRLEPRRPESLAPTANSRRSQLLLFHPQTGRFRRNRFHCNRPCASSRWRR